ncbi:MAG: hypothetical protein ABI239_02765 [Aquihabitans sp.]
MRKRSVVASFAVVLTLVAGGCSSSSDQASKSDSDKAATSDTASDSGDTNNSGDSGGTPSNPDSPCDLVSQEDAEAAFGGIELDLDEGFRDDACDYSAADPSEMASLTVEYDAGGLEGMKLEDLVDILADEDADVTPVDGLGDSAYAFKVISSDTLQVAIGDGLLTITMNGGPEDSVAAMTTVAESAIEKL